MSTVSTARQLKFHYVVERHSGDATHPEHTVLAQFHTIRDAEKFLDASLSEGWQHRIVCLTNRCQSASQIRPWHKLRAKLEYQSVVVQVITKTDDQLDWVVSQTRRFDTQQLHTMP